MTSVSKAYRVELPEGQGTVCLTEQGLRMLRSKIDKEIGVTLTTRRPPGVPFEQWDKFQATMAAERTARLASEAANAGFWDKAGAETARNIVAQLNSPRVEEELSFKYNRRTEPDPRVSRWVSSAGSTVTVQVNGVTGARSYQHTSWLAGERGWTTWANLGLDSTVRWTEAARFPEKLTFRTPCDLADVPAQVTKWKKDGHPSAVYARYNSFTGEREFSLSTFDRGPGQWVSWDRLNLVADRIWTEESRDPR